MYLASENITKKWRRRYRGWDQVLNQQIVLYAGEIKTPTFYISLSWREWQMRSGREEEK